MKLDPDISLKINPKFVQYITDDIIVFISGCNIIIYDLSLRKQKFILKKNDKRRITFLSIGTTKPSQTNLDNKTSLRNMNSMNPDSETDNLNEKIDLKDKIICLGEYSDIEECFYITFIKPANPHPQYHIKSTEKFYTINFCSILNNTNYCITLSQKKLNNKAGMFNTSTKISFSKYYSENFVCQETINEELTYCCYNPKNTIELIICGKGYLRLWNIFINEGVLKEHQQRFISGKKEKEHNFIKAQFFEKKSFLLIVGTKENMFYIIDSFTIIHEINMCYSNENIYDLNIQNILHFQESYDIGNLKETIDSLNKNDIDAQLKKISLLTNPIGLNNKKNNSIPDSPISMKKEESNSSIKEQEKNNNKADKDDVFKRLYVSKNSDFNDNKINKSNRVQYFELINDNLLLVIYEKDGCCLLYKIDWNKRNIDSESEEEFKKWKISDNRIIRIAKNVKEILGFSMYKPKNDIILIVDCYEKNTGGRSNISLFKLKKEIIKEKNVATNMLHFEFEVLNGYFENYTLSFIDFQEKKQNVFIIDSNNNLKIFNFLKNKYVLYQQFKEKIYSLSVNPCYNLFALSFENKVSIYGILRNNITLFCDLDVEDSICQWNKKGDYLVICGINKIIRKQKSYCLYFVDAKNFNTVNVFENLLNKIKLIKFVDNDRYLLCLSSNSYIFLMNLRIYGDCISLHEANENVASTKFKMMFMHNPKGKNYTDVEFDSKNGLVLALEEENNKLYIMSILNDKKKSRTYYKNYNIFTEVNCNLKTIQIIKELQVLIGGDKSGSINVYKWPFKDYDDEIKININENLITTINIDLSPITKILTSRNFSHFFCTTENSNIYLFNFLIQKSMQYFSSFEYFRKGYKPQVEMIIPPYDIYESNLDDIVQKEVNVYILNNAMEKLKLVMDEDIQDMNDLYKLEANNMETEIKKSTENEIFKFENITNEIVELKKQMSLDTEKDLDKMKNNIKQADEKYKNKIQLYDDEIARLKEEFQDVKNAIEEKYNTEASQQRIDYETFLEDYNTKYKKLKEETYKSLNELVNLSSEYDEANDKIVSDYKTLISNLDQKIKNTSMKNDEILKEENDKLEQAKILEEKHKEKLEQKVKESDKLIEKNVEIKQSIINVTQRTITFQEQLLETEKNLVKIDKKLEDLIVKNKHLEQIRFVLEHRMTSLEKEKSPLEGQCAFLENQKNKLTEEFNKIILQINKNNQELENKQSQLRASLIQNYEIHDQKNYVETKLTQLKNDLEQFLMNYQDSDEEKTLKENRANSVALNFRALYDKFFQFPIDDELNNFQFFSMKLQEQTDKEGIANNFDLIMRNKAEEKLAQEKIKVEELIDAKERGFKRIQNENTILITECNRLRKNLHEIYMHVIDIEQRFEALTNIDPKVSKSEIVRQIKEFIRITHEKIKENYSQSKQELIQPKNKKLKKMNLNITKNFKKTKNSKKYIQTESNMEENKEMKITNTETNAYVIFPEIRKSSNNFMDNNKKKSNRNKNGVSLPII